eukprot:9058940-Lingulodinium_polyedra.AAC.1
MLAVVINIIWQPLHGASPGVCLAEKLCRRTRGACRRRAGSCATMARTRTNAKIPGLLSCD